MPFREQSRALALRWMEEVWNQHGKNVVRSLTAALAALGVAGISVGSRSATLCRKRVSFAAAARGSAVGAPVGQELLIRARHVIEHAGQELQALPPSLRLAVGSLAPGSRARTTSPGTSSEARDLARAAQFFDRSPAGASMGP